MQNDSKTITKRLDGDTKPGSQSSQVLTAHKTALLTAKTKLYVETKAVNQYEKDLKNCELYGINPTPAYSGYLLKKYDKQIQKEVAGAVAAAKKKKKEEKKMTVHFDDTDLSYDCDDIEIFENWSKQTKNIMVPIDLYKVDFYVRELRSLPTEMNTNILQQLTNISALVTNISTSSAYINNETSTIASNKKLPTMCQLNCIATKAESSDSEEYY